VEWLIDNARIDARWCLIHATHTTEGEVRALAASGATAGLCPLTEASLGDGIFPGADYLAAGGAFGIGTDSNIQIDAAAELRQLEYAQRLAHRSRNAAAPTSSCSTRAIPTSPQGTAINASMRGCS
jgi:cytosine/adenosine deaminase-related metal-dependent hydrolase